MEGLERQMEILGIKNKEKWIKDYNSSRKLLLVGEGDFSFAACLGKAFGSAVNMVATYLYSKDLSNNLVEREIPEVIGDLKLLEVLNLSRNNLIGEIPASLSKLTLLESLDLSKNKFTGEIPMKLLSLTFLSVLKLSYNRLVGKILIGNQFSTFANDSYEGNLGMCGFPLSKKCDEVEDHQPSAAQQESILSDLGSPFSWKFALVGYGCGVPMGVVIRYILFWRTKRCTEWIEQSFKAKIQQKNEQNRRRRR